MVYCVQIGAAFSTAARRNTVLTALQTRIAGKPRWSVDVLEPATFRFGANGLHAELRFVSSADADDLKARLEAVAIGAVTPITGSWVRVHTCTHDEATNVCTVVAERVW